MTSISRSACEAFELRLNDVLDERRDPRTDSLLMEHARACPDCGRQLRVQTQWLGTLQSEHVARGVPRAWAKRIADQHSRDLKVTAHPRKNSRRLHPVAWMVLVSMSAATVAIALTLNGLSNRGPDGSMANSATSQGKAANGNSTTGPKLPGSTLAVSHRGDSPNWDDYEKTLRAWETALDPQGAHRETLESSVEPITHSLRPVGHSFGTVLGGLRKTLPVSRQRRAKPAQGAWSGSDPALAV